MIKAKNRTWVERVDLDDNRYYVKRCLQIEFDPDSSAWALYNHEINESVVSFHSCVELAKWAGDQIEREMK